MRRQSSYQNPNIDMASALAPEAVPAVRAVRAAAPAGQAVVRAVPAVVLVVLVVRGDPEVRAVPVCIRSPPDRAVGSTCVLAIQTDQCN